jgi:uncharacterized protein (TIGR03118 family)
MCRSNRRLALIACALFIAAGSAPAGQIYVQTNLVSNDQSVVQAQHTDANLINPWGIAYSTGSPLWVGDQGSGVATLYSLSGTSSTTSALVPTIPNLGNAPSSSANGPTGQVSTGAPGITTGANDFQVGGAKAAFIFANMDGSISAWKGGTTAAVIEASTAGASYTGLAIGNTSQGAAQIYAADQNSSRVDIFNSSWSKVGSLNDPNLPSGFTAFNVQNIGGALYVTYANQANPLGGIVDQFTTDGTFVTRLVNDPAGTHLDQPWGLALAPAGWGAFGGDLLVGNNNGDGTINAYTLGGVWQGQLDLNTGQAFSEGNLWGMMFGSGSASGGSPNVLYFAAGLDGNNGLLGAISAEASPVPEPSTAVLALIAVSILGGVTWRNARRRPRIVPVLRPS